ncbi:MAG: BrnT family toxin [Acetobacteraceae bacterium]
MHISDVTWDERKRQSNLVKHGLDFFDVIAVLDGPCLVGPATTVGGEERRLAVGLLDDVTVAVIFTMRGSVLRVISMRRARHDERNRHRDAFGL